MSEWEHVGTECPDVRRLICLGLTVVRARHLQKVGGSLGAALDMALDLALLPLPSSDGHCPRCSNQERTASSSQPAEPASSSTAPGSARLPSRHYVVPRCPKGKEQCLGIWTANWSRVAANLGLPRGGLKNSGFHARGFHELDDAIAFWKEEGLESPAPHHYA